MKDIQIKAGKERSRKMKKAAVLSAFLIFLPLFLCAEDYVNLRYIEKEKNAEVNYAWDLAEIKIRGDGKDIKIILNYPYIISEKRIIRIDTPPFTDGDKIFISGYTYKKIEEIIDGVDHVDLRKKKEEEESSRAEKKKEAEQKEKEKIKEVKREELLKEKEIKEEKKAKEEEKKRVKTAERDDEEKGDGADDSEPPEIKVKKKTKKVIVIDAGHGGNDPGAIGPSGVKEKDIVLGIAIRTAYYLRKEPGVKVYVTRKNDKFISLKKRAVFANNHDADLFVSIHCNASPNRSARGTRTYIYSRIASSKEAAAAAKLENKKVGMFEFLLNDLKKSAFEYLSIEAAGNIQHSLIKHLKLRWQPTERAPFYVLANTNMPSVLVEAAFISNPREEKKLNSSEFRAKVARGVADGIIEYLEKIK